MPRALTILLAAALVAAPAVAQTAPQIVEQAKAEGVVGERADGFLGVVPSQVDSDIKQAVDEINIQRRAAYTRLAEKQGVSVDAVARVTAEKLIAEKVDSGEYYMNASGQWVKK
ncbi:MULTISPECIES: YdbL family protein [Euryhalocaulis]|uniref:YdbL family protein n=1 Tax=Euryhalocaulis TaxID=1712422 RepID=UPI0003A110F1|nr:MULTISPECIES: YdbL family protein [Euryhalocaulis]MBA4802722.1 YdbL family protein [Euryhalocaulis sp.]